MRSKLGRIVSLSVAAATLIVAGVTGFGPGSNALAQEGATSTSSTTTTTDGSTTTTSTSSTSSTTTTTTTTTTTSTTTTTTSTTTTTEPPAPLVIELPPPPKRVTPSRGTAAQVTDTLPPPPTTTTTTPALPDLSILPANSGSGRRIVYSKSRMRVWTVESDGTVSKTHLVSGRRTWNQPLPGTYSVFSRSRYTCNINNPYICWRFMVRFTKGPGGDNIGFHEIPTDTRTGNPLQSLSQLGRSLSGGCVRQAPGDAAYMWDWAPIGTKVVVLG